MELPKSLREVLAGVLIPRQTIVVIKYIHFTCETSVYDRGKEKYTTNIHVLGF